MNNTLNKYTIGFGISAAITIIFNMILMILKEKIQSFHEALVTLSGHHWVSHGLLDIFVFVLLGYFFSKLEIQKNISNLLLVSVVISVAGIMIFFIF